MVSLGLPCLLRVTTGLDCPLCGATRATDALLRGDVLAALDFNALYVVALPALALLALLWLRTGERPSPLNHPATGWIVATVAVAFAVVRNLPAFTVLGA